MRVYSEEEKDELIATGTAFEELLKSPYWKPLEAIIDKRINYCKDKLIEADSELVKYLQGEAKGLLEIKRIIRASIERGRDAREQKRKIEKGITELYADTK
jgi:F0F1-type ATP synthase membrane subunit b/b'